jgi:hypothetical protein
MVEEKVKKGRSWNGTSKTSKESIGGSRGGVAGVRRISGMLPYAGDAGLEGGVFGVMVDVNAEDDSDTIDSGGEGG